MKKRRKSTTQLVRELRKSSTEGEKILWKYLRKRKLGGYRFVRQKPFVGNPRGGHKFFFIADFIVPKRKELLN